MAKILLVEDDNNLREIFEMRLKAEGFNTVTAGNGEEALVVAMKEKPDLIIADVMMPKLSGFEMLETLRAAPEMSDTKAIMMTALGQAEDRARGERLGVIKYLVKSQVTLEDFVRVVREVVSPDQAASGADPAAAAVPPATSDSQQINKESEQSMPEEPSTIQPTPTDGGNDSAGTNPVSGAPADPLTPSQPNTEQEQSAVQDQINSFVSNPGTAAPDAAAAGGDTTGGAGSAPTSADSGMGGTDGSGAGTDTGAQPDIPVATPPADPAPQPPTDGTGGQSAPGDSSQPSQSSGV